VGAPSDIDRLIELGLNRYGAGDLDGALLMWEEALAIDPDNARANGYVDYVRHNYDLLSSEPEVTQGDDAPFGIEEEPEYQIEVAAGELVVERESQPVLAEAGIDAGWFDEEKTHDVSDVVGEAPTDLELEAEARAQRELEAGEPPELELEADAPPDVELELEAEPPPPNPEVNFEDATREYYGTPTKPAPPPAQYAQPVPIDHGDHDSEGHPADFSENAGTSEFQHEYSNFSPEGTPVGFAHQETEIRKRDVGFVTPTPPPAAPVPVTDKPSSPLSIGTAPTMDTLSIGELTLGDLTMERLASVEGTQPGEKTTERTPPSFSLPDEPDENDLLAGLPTPRRPGETQPPATSSKAPTKELPDLDRLPGTKAVTKELPDAKRPPARRDSSDVSQAAVVLQHAPTKDFDASKIEIGAPTRDLGLRPTGKRPGTLPNPVDEDAPTKQSDVRALRDTLREQARAASASETTRSDIVLPFDPIDARATQILEEVDANAPENEAQDDQTRRRIGALLERAVAWNQEGDTDRAVCAVDLALEEDPNSAIAQKLITRHRDAIMSVFQGYLGSLDRQPQLAKPLHELQNAPISPRAAFLLSRIDGTLTIDELLDVSGMPRLEAFRHICQLYLRGILR
jgi:hypothetical protein